MNRKLFILFLLLFLAGIHESQAQKKREFRGAGKARV